MAMLAEKRRKSKFVLTPVAKPLWTLETSHFGKKMMEKMGWAAGKGLGALEQGIHEPLRANYKQDSKGMGYSGQGNPFENLDQFNALLASLSGEVSTEDVAHSFQSLEEKSKQSRSRVHYKKFTRGKDVSRYSNVDLSCIVGVGKKVEEETVEEEIDHTGEEEHSHGVTTINSGSIADYFMLKMRKKTDQPETEVAFESEDIRNDEEKGANKSSDISEEDSNVGRNDKKNKRNRDESKMENEEIAVSPQNKEVLFKHSEEHERGSTDFEPLQVKSKKKKKHNEKLSEEENIVDSCNSNELNIEKKSKKKKKRDKEICDDENKANKSLNDVPNENLEICKKHKSKKRKKQDKEINTNFEECVSAVELDGSKKKKHRKDKYLEIDAEILEINCDSVEHKQKKKKKKDKIQIELCEEQEHEATSCSNIIKSEKKKRKKEKLIDECAVSLEDETPCEGSLKKKCKLQQEDNEKDDSDLKTQTKKIKKNNNETSETMVHQDQKELQSDEISKQFKGSNLGSLPGYGYRRANLTGN